MTPLHTPPAAPIHTSYTPLAPSQDYAAILQQWVDNTPLGSGEDRTTAAHQILYAAKTNLVHLDLSNFGTLTALPESLPAGLTSLSLWECHALTTLPDLPAGLTRLNLNGCYALTTLPEILPAGVTELSLTHCHSLTTLPKNLPDGLTKLSLFNCNALAILPERLPDGLITLDLKHCHAVTTLPPLPAKLTTLDLGYCHAVTTLPPLPAGLTTLDLFHCHTLTTLPKNLPTGLTALDFTGCHALATLPHLPAGLTRLDLTGCRALTALPNLPAGFTALDISGCNALTALPETLPAGLTKLSLVNCHALTTLPEILPAGVTELNFSGCRTLTTLPGHLPAGLSTLTLADCHMLTALPAHLPAGLTWLNLSGCHALTALPVNLPQNLVIYGYKPLIPTNPLTQWCQRAGKSAEYTANLHHAWQQLKATEGAYFVPFETLIRRLGHSNLLNSVPPIAVLEIVESVIQSPELRHLIFAASREADANCHDRPLTIFNTVQGLARFATLQHENAAPQAILNLAIGMVKQTLLDEATVQVMHQQWQDGRRTGNTTGTGPNTNEALEVQLALRHQLGAILGLPFLVNNPLYTTMAKLNDADRAFATQYVNDTVNNNERLTDALLAQPIWRLYLESILAEEISVIKGNYTERQDQLEQQMADGSFNDHEFLQAMNTLMKERQGAIDALFKQKTAALLG